MSRTPARHRKPPRSSSARPGVHARRHKRSPITSALVSKPTLIAAVAGSTLVVSTAVAPALAHWTGSAPGATALDQAGGAPGAISRPASSGPAATDTVPAHRTHHPPGRDRPTSRQPPRQQAAGQHPAGSRHQAPAPHPAPPRHPVMPGKPAAPYLIYDSVIPSAIPAHDLVATYATGPFAVSPSQVAGRGPVLWIDVYGTDYEASALDVEPGDATPALAANWAWHRLSAHPDAIAHIYTALSEWPAVQAAVATLPAWMRARIRWWIADPTGIPHIVPGSDATQWYWGSGYDITTATPRF